MKLSFSTLGCPGWTVEEMIAAAADLGYAGVEFRAIGAAAENEKIIKKLAAKGAKIACLATDALLHETDEANMELAKDYIMLAGELDVPYIRVLGDTAPAPGPGTVNLDLVQDRLCALAPLAAASGVTLLVESNGVLAESARLRALIEAVGSEAVQVLWDLHHPARYFNETPAQTYAQIGLYVKHVHLKDAKMENGVLTYKMLGYGDLPVKEAMALLGQGGYDGFYSLEWTKRWNRELEDAGIVFAQFVKAMQKFV